MQVQMQNKGEQLELIRKDELLRKKKRRGDLPKKEEEELQAILAEEEAENRRQAMIHNLSERATKHAKKRISRVRKEATDKVQLLKLDERAERQVLIQSFNDKGESAKQVANSAINEIQQELGATLASLRQSHTKQEREILARYKPQYDDLETRINMDMDDVGCVTRYFRDMVKPLTLEELKTLDDGGVVKVSGVEGTEYLICPDVEPKT